MYYSSKNFINDQQYNIYKSKSTFIQEFSKQFRNLQSSSIPFESICAGEQDLNCGQHGKCVSLGISSNTKQFLCVCADGFTGPLCNKVWDACLSVGPTSLCLNGGLCTSKDTFPYYSCNCTVGFTGNNCELENNVCKTNNPCQNGGKCSYVGENFPIICTCKTGYTGDYCQITVQRGIGGAGVQLYPSQIILTWAFLIILLASILYCTFSIVYDIIAQIRANKKKREQEKDNVKEEQEQEENKD